MKFKQYILDQEKAEEIKQLLKRDCKKFLSESNELFWRGTYKHFDDYIVIKTRTNRKPMTTKAPFHEWADEYFQKYFGWKARSEGVFATPSNYEASAYGPPCMFFPIGNYKYIWSPDIDDFTFKIAIPYKTHKLTVPIDTSFPGNDTLKDLMETYTDKKLNDNSENEIMFKCKSYYLVDGKYERYIEGII